MTDDRISAAAILPDVQIIREAIDRVPLDATTHAQWAQVRTLAWNLETHLRWIRDEAKRLEEGDSQQIPLCLGAGRPRLRDENDDRR
jgi:hypothetical protein